MSEKPFVVGLSGAPGSGKTTLLKLLSRDYPRAEAVAYDRFHPGMDDQQIQEWVLRNGDPNEFPLTALIGELNRLTAARTEGASRPLVFFETAFGRVHRTTGAFIDFSIWIETPLDVALARANLVFLDNVARSTKPSAAADFIPWLTRYMRDYALLRRTYLTVSERAAASVDLVIDGIQPPEASAARVVSALIERGIVSG
jgi:uridine kinase